MQSTSITYNSGLLNRDEIREEVYVHGNLTIAPFDLRNLKGSSYNITPSSVIISARKGIPLRVFKTQNCVFVKIPPHDTALVLMREYIKTTGKIAGTVFSRVRTVSSGLGHISTTIDPYWEGQGLVALNNPSSKSIKLLISREERGESIPQPFATIYFYYIKEIAPDAFIRNPDARIDILESIAWKTKNATFPKGYKQLRSIISTLKLREENNIDDSKISEMIAIIDELRIFYNSKKGYDKEDFLKCLEKFRIFDFGKFKNDTVLREQFERIIEADYSTLSITDAKDLFDKFKQICLFRQLEENICERNDKLENIVGFSWNGKLFDSIPSLLLENSNLIIGYLVIIVIVTIIMLLLANFADESISERIVPFMPALATLASATITLFLKKK